METEKPSPIKNIQNTIRQGLRIKSQDPGLPVDGPITLALRTMAAEIAPGQPLSPVGTEISRLFSSRKVWVWFVYTSGQGAAPWKNHIILDANYLGPGQVRTPDRVGLIAHELTHVLQREINDPVYYPSGLLKPSRHTRWIADSTSYMEVLAYMIGWCVEYDLLIKRYNELDLEDERRNTKTYLGWLEQRLATLTAPDVLNAARYIISRYPGNKIYRQNYQAEKYYPDHRIPQGDWVYWLERFGFGSAAISHIRSIAALGEVAVVSEQAIA